MKQGEDGTMAITVGYGYDRYGIVGKGGRGGGEVVNLLPNDHGFRKTIVNK